MLCVQAEQHREHSLLCAPKMSKQVWFLGVCPASSTSSRKVVLTSSKTCSAELKRALAPASWNTSKPLAAAGLLQVASSVSWVQWGLAVSAFATTPQPASSVSRVQLRIRRQRSLHNTASTTTSP